MREVPWVVFPTTNLDKANRAIRLWRKQRYQIAVSLDRDFPATEADMNIWHGDYPGYWVTANNLTKMVMEQFPASVVVVAADDLFPDPKVQGPAIVEQFRRRFPDTFGVMQPIGDTTMPGTSRICGSPWIGRKFVEESYGGKGPYHEGYFHFYGDEEMYEVTKSLNVLQQRKDLAQKHLHWCRPGHERTKRTEYQKMNSHAYWERDKKIFTWRKKEGFPGHARKA